MNVFLLYPEKEWLNPVPYPDQSAIVQDLNLNVLFRTAGSPYNAENPEKELNQNAQRDAYLVDTMRRVMMVPLQKEEDIYYRQEIIRDVLRGNKIVEYMYTLAGKATQDFTKYTAVEKEKWYHGANGDNDRLRLSQLNYMRVILDYLDRLKELIVSQVSKGNKDGIHGETVSIASVGLKSFVDRFLEEYNDEFQSNIREVIADIGYASTDGKLELEANLGKSLELTDITVCRISDGTIDLGNLGKKIVGTIGRFAKNLLNPDSHFEQLKDLNQIREADMLKNTALATMMGFFSSFMEDVKNFFKQLQRQTAFYVGAANVARHARRFHLELCYPKVTERETLAFENLYEITMAIYTRSTPVPNSIRTENKHLVIITGANQGGKSTFLRSMGVAQVMFQCGMFVAAQKYEAGLFRKVFTHFTRREDSEMNSGRLDEELGRMEQIINNITQDSVLYLNESFATTTEKEGSVIAHDIVKALYERKIRVMMVTHLLQFANECYEERPENAVFLAAERTEKGKRTYRILENKPEMTSYGLDLYEEMIER